MTTKRDALDALSEKESILQRAIEQGSLFNKDARETPAQESKSHFWRDFVWLCVFSALIGAGVWAGTGKSVQSRVGAATQKMVGSITHDAQLEDYGADGRVQAEKARENLMTHQ
jgi:hypothetical protein